MFAGCSVATCCPFTHRHRTGPSGPPLPAHRVPSSSAQVSQESHIFPLVGGGRRCAARFPPAVPRILLQHLKHKFQKRGGALRKTTTRSQARGSVRRALCNNPAACSSKTHQTRTALRRSSQRIQSPAGRGAVQSSARGHSRSQPADRSGTSSADKPSKRR